MIVYLLRQLLNRIFVRNVPYHHRGARVVEDVVRPQQKETALFIIFIGVVIVVGLVVIILRHVVG
jgi:hypothetical protein